MLDDLSAPENKLCTPGAVALF